HDAMADEDAVLDGHAFANEAVAGNLAILADDGVALDFDERADAAARADATPVEVDEIGVVYDHALVQHCIRRYHCTMFLLPGPLPGLALHEIVFRSGSKWRKTR